MIKYFLAVVLTGGYMQLVSAATPTVVDSVGTVVKNGKSFTIHKVAPKETIYALARRYGVSVTQVQQANPGITSLAVGQTVFVPSRPGTASSENNAVVSQVKEAAPGTTSVPDNAAPNNSTNRVHQVGARQTLFSVARLYKVSTTDLKKWNNLTSDNLQEGQTLIVSAPVSTSPTPSESHEAVTSEEENTPPKVITPAPASKTITRREEVRPAATPTAERENVPVKEERTETRVPENLSRISEMGLAEVMDKGESNKYLALHKTAPVGTILQVKNTLNNQSVYVRVTGKLPENTANDRVIIRVSKRAYQKLAATDNRFQVEINYMP